MPIKNGIQVIQEVKQFYADVSIRLPQVTLKEPLYVFLTAFSTLGFKNHVLSTGADHVLEKPLSKSQLQALLHEND